jgi:hypothetical protein
MKELTITWQRLLSDEGTTCPRCGGTEAELDKAAKELQGMGFKVKLEKKGLNPAEFKAAPRESNRIMINNKPLEHWLSAGTGSSPCCAECGDEECRTIEAGGQSYETIPAELIVQAALAAS